MTDLTKQWKAGELEEGWYYILNHLNIIRIEQANVWIGRQEEPFVAFDDDSGIKEVIAQVPNYEDLQALKEENARQKELIQRLGSDIEGLDIKKMLLIVEVNNLKGLLKECKELIKRSFDDYPDSAIYRAINSAIGESEE